MKTSSARNALTLLLGALFAVLTALVIWRPGLEAPTRRTVTELEPDSIRRLEISGPEASAMVFHRRNGAWVIADPALMSPDMQQLKDVLTIAAAPSRADYPLAELDLRATGLDQPGVVLGIDGTTLEFGARAPLSGDRYVRVESTVHLLADSHHHTLTRPLDSYVATNLLPDRERLQAVDLPGLALRRVTEDRWEFQGKVSAALPAEEIARHWETAVAAAVQPYSTAAISRGRVELYLESSDRPMAFDILELPGKPDFILGRSDVGLQYHFAPEVGRRLLGMGAEPEPAQQG